MIILYFANIRLPTEKAHGLQIMKTCEAFARAGHTVELVVPNRATPIRDDSFAYYDVERIFTITRLPNIDTVRFGRRGFLLATAVFAFSALAYALSHDADSIFSRDEFVLYPISFFKRNIIWESHDGRINFVIRRLLRAAWRVVVTTESALHKYAASVTGSHLLLARNGVDIKKLQCDVKEAQALSASFARAGELVVMYLGRLDGWKGVQTLLDAAAFLPPTMKVVIVGGEPRQVEILRKQYPTVIFVGFVPYRDIGCYQQAADVLVLPNTGKDDISVASTSPLKLFTYMAAEKPIVAADLPSIREVIGEDACYFVPPDNPQALAHRISTVVHDAEGAQEKARRARALVEKYTWEARALKILQ